MRIKHLILGVAAMLLLTLSAVAQPGFDVYGQLRTIVLEPPRILDGGSATFTNNAIDTAGFEGIAKVDIYSCTNSGGALTVTPYTSTDKTNWTVLSNYSLAQGATVNYTNRFLGSGTNIITTNSYNLPGAITTPTANTAGFATPYLDNSAPFTNSGALTITTKKVYTIGFNVQDSPRYFQLVWTPTGSSSNDIVSATMTVRKQQFP